MPTFRDVHSDTARPVLDICLPRPDFHSNIRRLRDNTSPDPHPSVPAETPPDKACCNVAWTLHYIASGRSTTRSSVEPGCPASDARLELHVSRLGSADTQSTRSPTEDIMLILIIYLFPFLKKALDRAEHCRRDAYLASAADMGELERRMHSMED
jgi:hypothetical protein